MPHVVTLSKVDNLTYDVLVNDEKAGVLYHNMTGFVGTIPTHTGTEFSAGECDISSWKKAVATINRESREAEIAAANLQDRRLEDGLMASSKLLEMFDEIKADRDEFLAHNELTLEQARDLPSEDRDALNEKYRTWLSERNESPASPRM